MELTGLDPRVLCNKHLRAEHKRLHEYADPSELFLIKQMHDRIVAEMVERDLPHDTPFNDDGQHSAQYFDRLVAATKLFSACPDCYELARMQAGEPFMLQSPSMRVAFQRASVVWGEM